MSSLALRTIWGVLLLLSLVSLVFVATFYLRYSTAWKAYSHITVNQNFFSGGPLPETDENLERFFHLEPNTDNSALPSLVEEIQKKNPNLPIAFWNEHKNKPMYYKNESCANFPNIFDIHYNNKHWQTLQTSNGTFQLYGAYYETRKQSRIKPAVRILAMINRFLPTVKTYCQFWFSHLSEPVFGEVGEYSYMWFLVANYTTQGVYQPYMMSCKIPSEHQKEVPASVSLVENPCDSASNNLRVIYNKPAKKSDFAVCIKGLDMLYNDQSVRIVEWIEVLLALGANKIYFYELYVHPNTSKVLQHYQELGRIDVTPYSLSAEEPNLPGLQHMFLRNRFNRKRQNEVIAYNDCFYKNMYSYRYVILLDTDEVLMPVHASSWKELMDTLEKKALAVNKQTRAFYSAQNVYFFDDYPEKHGWTEDIPRYLHMMQHVYRSTNFTGPGAYLKSFFDTERIITLHNHYPLTCLSGCSAFAIPTSDAQLQHYRANCVPELHRVCDEFRRNVVSDTSIWKVKDRVIRNTINVLKKLGFFHLK